MKCKAHIQTYKHGSLELAFETASVDTILKDGDLAVDEWENKNDDSSFRESYEDENGVYH